MIGLIIIALILLPLIAMMVIDMVIPPRSPKVTVMFTSALVLQIVVMLICFTALGYFFSLVIPQ